MIPIVVAVALSYVAAFLLRFEFTLPNSVEELFRLGFYIFVPAKGFAFWIGRIPANRWRLVGLFDLYCIAMANLAASALAFAVTAAVVGPAFPRSVYIIDWALCFLATSAIQFCVRLYREVFAPNVMESSAAKTILIYGAGAAGQLLGKEFRSNPKLRARIAGFLDDDPGKQGGSLDGMPILGRGCDASDLVATFAREQRPISEIVIAMPSATSAEMRVAIAHCRAAGIPFKTIPGVSELLDGKIGPQIREVCPNDLLGREPVRIDEDRISRAIAGEAVLVTGGCGSIGSELCRQIARFEPGKLVIFDQAESEMFMLAMDLRKRYPDVDLATEIGDIFRASRVKDVISRHAISVVFHAAAYKHVPLMEENVTEAIENNVIGTYNVARAAHQHGVKTFVLISSDKAVNPTSIMGVTKRVAELIVSAKPFDGVAGLGTFVSVRFGNVLGSAGSVIPIFQRQIASGGPVTVTHPEMRRYFMSISEAVQLVLEASTMGRGSEVFVLDMGEPVRIVDLAHNMIRLGGLVPGEDIEICFTGLRPGEKLYEELQLDGEDVLPTPHEKIKRFRSAAPNPRYIGRWLERMRVLLTEGDCEAQKAHLLQLVPEYQGSAPARNEADTDRLALVNARAS
ncbi:MAG TPA: nucleoside-diphosphate sugar epimerase/dehydratase [Bryobacteraceae bacterium]|nr:nucleoside-diphosphate sugar epimerase/dehydratase [Bryobacteraceae bacterium]